MNVKSVHPMLTWARKLAERRSKPIAAIALARKLAGILYRMWRDGTDYQPRLTAPEHLQA